MYSLTDHHRSIAAAFVSLGLLASQTASAVPITDPANPVDATVTIDGDPQTAEVTAVTNFVVDGVDVFQGANAGQKFTTSGSGTNEPFVGVQFNTILTGDQAPSGSDTNNLSLNNSPDGTLLADGTRQFVYSLDSTVQITADYSLSLSPTEALLTEIFTIELDPDFGVSVDDLTFQILTTSSSGALSVSALLDGVAQLPDMGTSLATGQTFTFAGLTLGPGQPDQYVIEVNKSVARASQPVPEPASLLMVTFGGLLLAAAGFRRRGVRNA